MRSNERARREMEKEVNSEGSRRRRWRREGLPHRAALNMNIIMRTGFVVVPLLRSSSFGRSPVLLLSRLAAPHPLVLSHPPLFPFTSALYTYMRARCTAPRRAEPFRAAPAASATTTKRDVSLYLLNCLLAPNSTLCSPLPRVSLMQADPSASATPPGVIMRAYRTV